MSCRVLGCSNILCHTQPALSSFPTLLKAAEYQAQLCKHTVQTQFQPVLVQGVTITC